MSKCESSTVACPACRNKIQVTVWQSANVSLDKDVKAKILERKLNRVACKCGNVSYLVYDMLYHDMDKHLMIWLLPPEGRSKLKQEQFTAMTNMMHGPYKYRIVADMNGLVELIKIYDAGFNDYHMQILKHMTLEKQSPHDMPWFYDGIRTEKTEKYLSFGSAKSGQIGLLPLDEDFGNMKKIVLATSL